MNDRVMQFRVGVMVVATVLITAILIFLFEGFPVIETKYPIYIHFDAAPGVAVGTPVRESGILIGRVSHVQFAREIDRNERGVVATSEVEGKYQIGRDEKARLDRSFLGDSYIEFSPVPEAGSILPASNKGAASGAPGSHLVSQKQPGVKPDYIKP